MRGLDQATIPFAVRVDLPDWLAEKLLAQFTEAEALAPRAGAQSAGNAGLARQHIQGRTRRGAGAPDQGRRCRRTHAVLAHRPAARERAALFSTQSFKDGLFEVQDEGSQLLSYLLEPKRNDMIVDFCAGAGGKNAAPRR